MGGEGKSIWRDRCKTGAQAQISLPLSPTDQAQWVSVSKGAHWQPCCCQLLSTGQGKLGREGFSKSQGRRLIPCLTWSPFLGSSSGPGRLALMDLLLQSRRRVVFRLILRLFHVMEPPPACQQTIARGSHLSGSIHLAAA